MKVTPDSDAPIMPNATIYHGDFLLPMKKDSLSAFLEVNHETSKRSEKYEAIMHIISVADNSEYFERI